MNSHHEEKNLQPVIEEILKSQVGIYNAISTDRIISLLSNRNLSISEETLNRIIQQIRIQGSVDRLIAASHGYYVSKDCQEVAALINYMRIKISELKSILGLENQEKLTC